MKQLLSREEGLGMVIVIAFMGLAIPLITTALTLAGSLSLDSQTKNRKAQGQYAATAVLEYVHYLLSNPETWEKWRQSSNDQDSITINGQEIAFTVSGGEEVSISTDSIWQDETVGSAPDGDGIGTSTPQIRSQRDGSGDGRVYHISFTATPTMEEITVCSDAFNSATGCEAVPVPGQGSLQCTGAEPSVDVIWSPNGTMVSVDILGVSGPYHCSGEVLVGVSSDSKTPPVDGGALYDSTQADS